MSQAASPLLIALTQRFEQWRPRTRRAPGHKFTIVYMALYGPDFARILPTEDPYTRLRFHMFTGQPRKLATLREPATTYLARDLKLTTHPDLATTAANAYAATVWADRDARTALDNILTAVLDEKRRRSDTLVAAAFAVVR